MNAPVLEQLQPLAFLLGTWRGQGRGFYPTVPEFTYEEEALFTHTGRAFLVYSQRTWQPETGRPMHSENGFVRLVGDGKVEIVVAHAFGVAEIGEGTITGQRLEVVSTRITKTSTAKTVDAISRAFEVEDEVLRYTIGMAYGGHPLQDHLVATLQKTDA
ncbi:MAG: FABP family protein [Actinomycetota bacterium]|nr:FABP family protein [Actinomycetota bacterium]